MKSVWVNDLGGIFGDIEIDSIPKKLLIKKQIYKKNSQYFTEISRTKTNEHSIHQVYHSFHTTHFSINKSTLKFEKRKTLKLN